MIILDTHIWIWWVHGSRELSENHKSILNSNEKSGLGISVISCWEVAKLVEYKRLTLPLTIENWMYEALAYPGIQLLELTPEIAIESTKLPEPFHRDPADQIIVATARIHNYPLVTVDEKIMNYPFVEKIQ